MKQLSLAQGGFERYGKTTKRAAFLAEMDRVVPWTQLCALIEPHYPKAGRGRHPVGLERMLRIHFLQHWLNLSDLAVEEALYESSSMRQFVGIVADTSLRDPKRALVRSVSPPPQLPSTGLARQASGTRRSDNGLQQAAHQRSQRDDE